MKVSRLVRTMARRRIPPVISHVLERHMYSFAIEGLSYGIRGDAPVARKIRDPTD